VAVKVARGDGQKRSMLEHEEEVLETLQACKAVPRFVARGQEASCSYIVMQLLGENLSEMRRLTASKCFTLRTTVLLCVQIVDALMFMHDRGYIHRDIKPSNCCIGLTDNQMCYLLDFGLARRWRTQDGTTRPARSTAEFRGTCRYASVHSHQHEELSRRDDLWSLVYMLLELHGGALPWNATRDHDEVLRLKRAHVDEMLASEGRLGITAGVELPGAFFELVRHLHGLGFADAPNYKLVRELLLRGLTDDQVRDHLRARYGDFILFRPDFNARTAWLWLAPVALLLLGLGVAWRVLRRRGALVSEDDSPIEEPRR
jgi:tau tubulin kinase